MKISPYAPIYTPRQEAELLARVAAVNPGAVVVIATMIGVGPCPGCNFIQRHCKCKVKAP